MKIERCTLCNGRKEVNGIGGMTKECPRCFGIGHVKVEEALLEVDEKLAKQVDSFVKAECALLSDIVESHANTKSIVTPIDLLDQGLNKLVTKEFTMALSQNIEDNKHKPQRGRPKRG